MNGVKRAGAVTIVVAAAVAAIAPLPRDGVERAYSSTLYLWWQPLITGLSNRAPIALFDIVLAAVVGGWLLLALFDLARRRRRGWVGTAGRIAGRTVVWSAAVYLTFLAAWGLNYQRVPLADRLHFDPAAVTPARATALATASVSRLNALHGAAHRRGWPAPDVIDRTMATAFAGAQTDLGAIRLAVPGRPKTTRLDWYFRLASVDGMTDPFFLESLIARDLLPVERPFVVAHEWAHLAGLADEGEANFAGWITCRRAGMQAEYSGWLFLYGQLAAELDPASRRDVAARLDPGPRGDLQAIAARVRRHVSPRLSAAGWRVYDRYLKANRVDEGAASYAGVIDLMLGTALGRRSSEP
jgi:hypothetical protein